MAQTDSEELRDLLNLLKSVSYVKPEDLPNIDLYMDQVTTFMDRHLESSKRYSEDKLLTKTMINNYTKNDLLPSPDKKKYSKDHMYLLILIYYLKNVLSITDIQSVLKPLNEKYFNNAGAIPLEKIYSTVFEIQKTQADLLAKDVTKKFMAVRETFAENKEEDREFLQKLSMICLLSFDVYMKRQLIEQIIDTEFVPLNEKAKEEKKPKEEKKVKEEKKDKKKEA